jgi:hypothetical protein
LEAFRGKTVFLGLSGKILEFFWSGWRVFGAKDRAPAEFGKILGVCGFLECLEWSRTYL